MEKNKETYYTIAQNLLHTNPNIFSRVVGLDKLKIIVNTSKRSEILRGRMGIIRRDRIRNDVIRDRLKEDPLQERIERK